MELKDIRQEVAKLAKLMSAYEVSELELEMEGLTIKLCKHINTSPPREIVEKTDAVIKDSHLTITAPMVGTFYRAPAPDEKPYINVGDTILPGQTVCIIEAMKIMNEIQSEVTGKVAEILIDNAEPVEYGQALFVLETLQESPQ